MRQEILQRSGAVERIGWAFGIGLERLAMCLYDIPDIRLFWSNDSGFLNQFKVDDPNAQIQYKVENRHNATIVYIVILIFHLAIIYLTLKTVLGRQHISALHE